MGYSKDVEKNYILLASSVVTETRHRLNLPALIPERNSHDTYFTLVIKSCAEWHLTVMKL